MPSEYALKLALGPLDALVAMLMEAGCPIQDAVQEVGHIRAADQQGAGERQSRRR
ncbi:hypothetical protein GCM10017688_64950 [Streptomyces ramulosus]